jgi:hypothetical protein
MEYTLLNELMAETRTREIERVDVRALIEAQRLARPISVRQALATLLVRAGVSLDHGAGERAIAAAAVRPAR